jgi:hypothetical protein
MRSRPSALRDFTVDHRTWLLSGVALFIGKGGAALAVTLLRAIALATNAFYYHRPESIPGRTRRINRFTLDYPSHSRDWGVAGWDAGALRVGQDPGARNPRGH